MTRNVILLVDADADAYLAVLTAAQITGFVHHQPAASCDRWGHRCAI